MVQPIRCIVGSSLVTESRPGLSWHWNIFWPSKGGAAGYPVAVIEAILSAAGALKFTGSAEPTVSSSDLPPPSCGVTCSTAKSYEAPSPPVWPPCSIHWSEVCAQSLHQTPYGATCSCVALWSCSVERAPSL